jgi:Fe-S-cluster containining protein
MNPAYEELLAKSRERQAAIKRQLVHLGRFNHKNFDHIVADFHDEVFEGIDCLDCGNCCRALGPQLKESDIKRAAKTIGMDLVEFVETQLRQDEDKDWVFNHLPCPFLEADNSCSIYDKRPHACQDYPHTQERNIQRKLVRLSKNTEYCPAAYLIAEKIIERFAKRSDPDADDTAPRGKGR